MYQVDGSEVITWDSNTECRVSDEERSRASLPCRTGNKKLEVGRGTAVVVGSGGLEVAVVMLTLVLWVLLYDTCYLFVVAILYRYSVPAFLLTCSDCVYVPVRFLSLRC